MIAVTGASGLLGRLVIGELLDKLPAGRIVAAVRNPDRAQDLVKRGVAVREADYDRPETLAAALRGVHKLLLISSSAVGRRVPQHRAVVDAARDAGVTLLAYTSLLRADTTPLGLGREHRETEALLQASGIPWVVLRNGWYTENYTAGIPAALQRGELIGCAGGGLISSAGRADYAAAAAAVLTGPDQAGRVYELAGDESYTLADLAAEISRQTGRSVAFRNLPEAEFRAALLGAGLPEGLAAMLADSEAGIARGALFDDHRQLSRLIGRPTARLAALVKAAL